MLGHQAAYVDHLLEVVTPSGSTSSWSLETSMTGRSRRSTPSDSPTRPSSGSPDRGRGRSSPAATTTPPTARVQLAVDRRRRCPPAHRRLRRGLAGRGGGRARPGRASTASPTSTRTRSSEPWQLSRPVARVGADRGDAADPRRPGWCAADGRWCWRTRSWPARSPATPSATSASAGSPGSRPRSSPASTTPRSATSTASRSSRRRPLQRVPLGLLVLRGLPPQGLVARRPGPQGLAAAEFVPAPVPRRLARIRGTSSSC